jgi:hypothetical protein
MTNTPTREGLPELPPQQELTAEELLNEAERIAANAYKGGRYACAAIMRELSRRLASQPTQGGGEAAWTHDAENYGNALNEAGWTFIEKCPEKSALLFNNTKVPLRAAILKYAELVSAALPHPQPVDEFAAKLREAEYAPCAECRRPNVPYHDCVPTPPPPSDAAQGVQAVRVDDPDKPGRSERLADATQREFAAKVAAHKGEGNG